MQELPWERRRRIGAMLFAGGARGAAIGAVIGAIASLPIVHDVRLVLVAIPILAFIGGITGAASPWLTTAKTVFVPLALVLVSVLLTGQVGLFVLVFAWPVLLFGALVLGGVIAVANDRARHRASLAAIERDE